MSSSQHLCAFIVAGCVASPALAAPVAYSEPPDLSNDIASPTVLPTLGIGNNTVTGGVDFNAGDTYDIFQISLPGGASISAITVAFSNYVDESTAMDPGNFGFFSAPGPSFVGFDGHNSFLEITFDVTVPASPSVFGVSAGALDLDGSITSAYASAADYVWTFTVVPAPGVGALATFGALGLTRRRRRRA